MQYLYRYFNDQNILLYIGISVNALARLAQHKQNQTWVDEVTNIKIEKYETREEVLAIEKYAIQSEKPVFNKIHNKNTEEIPPISLHKKEYRREEAVEYLNEKTNSYHFCEKHLNINEYYYKRIFKKQELDQIILTYF